MDIKTYVEQEYPEPQPNEYTFKNVAALERYKADVQINKNLRSAHEKGLDIAVRFAEWCNMTWEYNDWDNKWESLLNRDTYTTSELLTKYLDTLKTK